MINLEIRDKYELQALYKALMESNINSKAHITELIEKEGMIGVMNTQNGMFYLKH